MINLSVKVDEATLDKVKSAMAGIKNGYVNVLVTSINKTMTTVKTQATARIGNDLNLKASRIKEDFTIIKADYSNPSGAIVATGEPVGLINFGASQTKKGVTVKVKRSGSRSLLKHAFIAKGRGASKAKDGTTKEHVWWREGQDQQDPPKLHMQGKISKAAWPRFGIQYHPKFSEEYRFPLSRRTGPRIEDILSKNYVLDPVTIQANHLFLSNVDKKIDEVLRRYHG